MLIRRLAYIAVGVFILGNAVAQEIPSSLRSSVEAAVAQVKPALVRIQVVSPEYYEGREVKSQSSGSGVIITPEGHVVTNHHVAGHATRLVCTLSTKEEIEATLVGQDPLSDIAVLKLKPEAPRTFPTAAFGDSSKVKVGDHVLAMGSPMALSQSVTLGIVSNTEMIMPRWLGAYRRVDQDGEDVGSFVRWIGHDADIFGGNSGGPLVNLKGEIIGINEIRMALSGAIPGNVAKKTAEALIAAGKVQRSWLGILVQPRLKHSGKDRGILVASVIEDSPAAKAGFKAGDYLVRLAGKDIDVRFDEQVPLFNRMVADLAIGTKVEAVVLRGDEEIALTITTEEREEASPKQYELKQWGITVRDISLMMARELKREDRDGILVTSLRPGGPAGEAKPALQQEDVITAVGGTKVASVADLRKVTAEITKDATDPVPVLVDFDRRAQKLLTVVRVGIRDLEDPGREVKKAWLPVETQVLTADIAESLGKPDLTGFRITRVYPGTTAEEAGLQVGDLILAVDGMELEASDPEDYEELPVLIRQYKIDSTAELKILRGSENLKVEVKLVGAPRSAREMKKYRDDNFEFTVRDINFIDRASRKWEAGQEGVFVEEVKSGGWAELAMLNVSDLILAVDGQEIADVAAFEQVMKKVADEKKKSVVLKVLRGADSTYVELEPQWENGV